MANSSGVTGRLAGRSNSRRVCLTAILLLTNAIPSLAIDRGNAQGSHAIPNAAANSIAGVTAATLAFYAALNHGDADSADQYLLPGGDSFPRSGKALDPEASTQEESLRNLRRSFTSGLKFNVRVHDLQVRKYGATAIATFLTDGVTTAPGGGESSGHYRATYVWVRANSRWKIAHFHISPLTG